ncbi:MAG: carbonic anhydrase [Deltaproteobacteria bacterium]|nr:carbonic anhydrase [Deltaproteobacteria bacterium]
MKMKRFLAGLTVAAALTVPFQAFAGEGSVVTGDEALKKLLEGNARFMKDDKEYVNWGDARRKELTKGQNPFAIILSCSDSRVPPEHVFDQELGDLFVVRVAGNVADPIELGSVEYAAEHLNVPLVMVMGHRSCGAVKATVAGGKPEGNIAAIVKKITPAVNSAKKRAKDKEAVLDAAIEDNAILTAKTLTEKSEILKHLVESGKVKIVSAVYDLATGKVDVLDSGEEKKEGKGHEHKH